ncbi:MAG: hypothetical protein AABZ39_00190 [Spirochaetota bacterium]
MKQNDKRTIGDFVHAMKTISYCPLKKSRTVTLKQLSDVYHVLVGSTDTDFDAAFKNYRIPQKRSSAANVPVNCGSCSHWHAMRGG